MFQALAIIELQPLRSIQVTLIQRFFAIGVVGVAVWAGAMWAMPAQAQHNDDAARASSAKPQAGEHVAVQHAWVRANVAGQTATGAFMELTAKEDMQLVGAQSDASALTQLHEMAVVNDVMKMREITALALPAGTAVSLKPGSYHIMLMDLPQPLTDGQTVQLTLQLKNAKGELVTQKVQAPVKATAMSHKH